MLLAAVALGVAAGRGGAKNPIDTEASGAAGTDLSGAGLAAEDRALRARIAATAATKPLLAALEQQVGGAALARLLATEPWWREVRTQFQVSRVVAGAAVLASTGALELGTRDSEVVAGARRSGVASQLISIGGRPYALVAARLAVRPEAAPVLVLANPIELPAEAATARRFGSPLLWASALFMAFAAFALIWVRPSPTTVADDSAASDDIYDLTASGRRVARAKAPRPPALTPPAVPVAHPRHPTAPDGTPVAADGSSGQRFGRYQLLNRIGEGGMAEVFTAVANGVEGWSRVFVLKRLRPVLSRDKEAVAQFIDEARMQASLVHSNIVPVFDFGRVGDEYFMTQEYIVGRDLGRVVTTHWGDRQETLAPRLALYVAFETLLALHYAHTRRDRDGQPLGIVHRDVSPGNVILSGEGEVKLADFGVVKSNRRVSQTQVGMVKGNANFMSPEQARGQPVDARSDVFSVGLVLYYCLTHRLPYDGENDLEVLYQAASGPNPDLLREIDGLPSPAREALGRALAIDPAHRFASAAEFADVLAPHVAGAKAETAQLMKLLFGEALLAEAA